MMKSICGNRQRSKFDWIKSQQNPVKQMGLTSAICLKGPRHEDLHNTEELVKTLQFNEIFDTNEVLNHRKNIVVKLNILLKQWIKQISLAKNGNVVDAEKSGGKIYTFGSYRLGVHQKGADIDVLCVAPWIIKRTDYFTSFFELLKKQPEVTLCRAIEKAFVPIIKMNFDGIEIDLLFAQMNLDEIPDDLNLCDNKILKCLDPYSVRSLNGCRVTEEILSLVPNEENFCLTLRTIKLWAKKRGIYSNSLGYFGGVAWAILVARICQLYPNATASTLVQKFFLVFSLWKWPLPVLLKKPDDVDLGMQVWDPRINLKDRQHLMPIITPAYPQQNSTVNVSESTKKVIVTEINRGKSILDEIMLGQSSWDRLFEIPSFFYKYRHFIVLLVNSKTSDDHLHWCALVESKIRLLVANLEGNQHISMAHVNPKCFDYKSNNNSWSENNRTTLAFCSMWFIGLEFERTESLTVDLTESIQKIKEEVMPHAVLGSMSIDACYVKRKQLSQFLDPNFLKQERDIHNSKNDVISGKRKRSLIESHQDDNSDEKSAKYLRVL